jgi:hypothetical protein
MAIGVLDHGVGELADRRGVPAADDDTGAARASQAGDAPSERVAAPTGERAAQ